MYKVLLVDDEKQIIEGLTAIIDWQKYSCHVEGAAYNGRMGLELALSLKPDIIITDIRMPYMEGLDMIARIQEHLPHIKYIILSGFSEFEYAKQGMKLGVRHYALKPVEEKELENYLEQIVSTLNAEKLQSQELEQFKKMSRSGMLLLQEQLIKDLLNAGEDNEDLLEELEGLEVKFNHHYISCLSARFQQQLDIKMHVNTLDIQYHQEMMVVSLCYSPSEYALLLNHSEEGEQRYQEIIRSLQASLSHQYQSSVSIGVGSTFDSLAQISQSFRQARQAIGYLSLNKQGDILYFDQLNHLSSAVNLPAEYLDKIEAGLEQLNLDKAVGTIEEMLNYLQSTHQLKQIDLRMQCLNLYIITASKMTPKQLQQLTHLVGEDIVSLEVDRSIWTLKQCKEWISKLFQTIIQLKADHQTGMMNHQIVDEIKRFIHANYAEKLTLLTISEQFYMSPNYLSELFHRKTGVTFLTYLTKVRIDKAKQLLQSSDAKLYEVCNQIGYEDPKYFRKIFKKHVGITPSEFKNHPNAHNG